MIETVLSYIASFVCMSFMVFIFVKGIIKAIRNDRGYRQMEADRKAKGQPFLGMYDEELEKEMYVIDD